MSTSIAERLNHVEFADLDPVARLTKDILLGVKTLTPEEARFMVGAYYRHQDYRKAAGNQIKSLSKAGEPCSVIQWLFDQESVLEKQIQRAMDAWTDTIPVGRWSKSCCGIGPIISAGLLAHVDIENTIYAGRILRFGGYAPDIEWKKGEKRPWNNDLKTLFYHIGECFVKVQSNEKDFYGKIYAARKQYEVANNEKLMYKDQAAEMLRKKNIGKETEAYKWYMEGKLPPAQLHARARRHVVKIFINHWHVVAYFTTKGKLPPKPYVEEHLGHHDIIAPPNMDVVPGLEEAWRMR